MRKIGYAIIGFGGIAENRIAAEGFGLDKDRFAGHPRTELVGVTDTNPDRRVATEGMGVIETLLGLMDVTWERLDAWHDLSGKFGVEGPRLLKTLKRQLLPEGDR